jgi:signal transduction histidine kinase/DNA-binding response OmpR family regulator/sensor domain CHASE-containing protein
VTLRKRTLLIVGGMLAALVAGLSLASSTLLLGRFRSLDEERSRSELHGVLNRASLNLASLRGLGADWAFWDDTYRFAVGEQPDYEAQNLADASLASLGLNLFVVVDNQGRFVFATGFDPEKKTRGPLPAGIDSVVRAMPAFPAGARAEAIQKGILPLPGGMFLVVRAPILDSRIEGPSHGALVLGRWLDPADGISSEDSANGVKVTFERLAKSTLVPRGWGPIPGTAGRSSPEAGSISGKSPALVRPLAERVERDDPNGRVACAAVVEDFFGNEDLLIRADLPGTTAAEGRRAVRMLIGAFLVVGCLFGLMILLLLERDVLSRMGRLHREVTGIAAGGDFHRGVGAAGGDEISGLASSINDLLRTLDATLCGKEKMLQDLQRAKAEAEGILRAKSRFLSTMSHEIRTPMGAVLGMAGLLLDTELTEEQREHVSILQGGAENLLHILDDILDLSKIDEGKMVLDDIPFDPRETTEDVVGLLAWSAANKGLEITAAVDTGLPALVRGDQARVRQILTNLVGNAVKFTKKGEVAVAVTAAETNGREPELCFAVRDTGIGIAPDRAQVIFEEFTQEDQSTARRFGGTGLGLAISRRLATLMDGSLEVESVPGQGSTFRLTVPLRPAAPAAERLPADGRRILLVDDSEWSRAAVAALLRAGGHEVREAASASGALEIMGAPGDGIDLCILDRHMPDRDGLELTGEILRSLGTARRVPVLLLCRPGEAPRGVDIALLGVAGVIAKPVRRSRLSSELRRLGMESEAALASVGGSDGPAPESAVLPHGPAGMASSGDAAVSAASGAPSTSMATGGCGARDSIGAAAPGTAKFRDPSLPPPGFRVLIVDDNAVNRRVVRRMIEKAGGQTEEAEGGEIAVGLWREQTFDLVLMDVQMPGMDGYETTTAFRAHEATRGTHTPIIALTANALPEDRALCLASGMDEHLGKPVRSPDLNRVLSTWIKPHKEELKMEASVPEQPLQLERLDEVSGGDTEFEKELLGEFLRTAPILVEDAAKAIASGDVAAAQRAAHTLKGASGSIGAGPLAESSRLLEETCKQGRLEEAGPWVAQIQTRLDDLAGFALAHFGEMAA